VRPVDRGLPALGQQRAAAVESDADAEDRYGSPRPARAGAGRRRRRRRRRPGTPIHLIGPRGGTRLIDAGSVTFGN